MVFSSMVFLWIFLPIVLIVYWIFGERFGNRIGNWILLAASIAFYAWGEPVYVLLMIFSVLLNYLMARLIDRFMRYKKWILFLDIAANLLLLGYFKYFDFFATYFNKIVHRDLISLRMIALPLGISFYTFQAMSYVIDVYRGDTGAQKNFFKLMLYIACFPQMIAGPIVKYKDIADQLDNRKATYTKRVYGIKRFIYGLAKKVLLANFYGQYADKLFGFNAMQMSTGLEWLKMLFYTLQIYYDFSGYSDMAIGLGAMFGFDFMENFNYPYISKSIREFWRRWHISLSTWFKEYVYIPLGGNRKGKIRTYINLLIVFFLTGLWHGASLRFVAWGMFFGAFLVMERMFLGKILDKLAAKRLGFINLIYSWLVFMCAWVFFREDGIIHSLQTLKIMFVYQPGSITVANCVNPAIAVMLVIGVLFSGVLQTMFPKLKAFLYEKEKVYVPEFIFQLILLFLCVMMLVSDSYNAFIYFRF